ncbi:hypothetical protein [Deinococcus frigens]|uniref:hypothetical protein n=1 Tax=Deinococcus frigens TaxID=249403 RepID=UPI0004966F89|nr:hypothetical protein [Deinococcus frigens]
MNKISAITVTRAPDDRTTRIPEGVHELTIVNSILKLHRNRFGDKYAALHLTFAADSGLTASSMTPEFKGGIVGALTALKEAVLNLRDLTPERLMGLRGRRVRATISHRAYRNAIYANVTALEGRSL